MKLTIPQYDHETRAPPDDVIGRVPKYAMPNLCSMLPLYRNSEGEFIFRAFHTGNYDQLRHLPANLREQQVTANRCARMEAAHTFLMPALERPGPVCTRPANEQHLFSTFEYLPSPYMLEHQALSRERVGSESLRLTVGRGKEFRPAQCAMVQKHQDLDPAKPYPYMADRSDAVDALREAKRLVEESRSQPTPFLPSGTQKLEPPPTKAMKASMLQNLRKWILEDWEGAEVCVFENDSDCVVIQIGLASVDSPTGLTAYMNVFMRCNALTNKYRLTKVVEFWNAQPGDGCAYYVLRPPWVHVDKCETYYALHPEETDYRGSFCISELQKERQALRAQVFS
ncbi:MAG: hypothetical protein WDW36_002051 [Sanguina aurantia]